MTDILVLSDLHQEFPHKFKPPTIPRDILFLCGDINIGDGARNLIMDQLQYGDVVYVHGNHEYYGKVLSDVKYSWFNLEETINFEAEQSGLEGRLYFLQNTEVEFDGFRILGCTLWASMEEANPKVMALASRRMNDYHKIKQYQETQTPYSSMWRKLHPDDTVRDHKYSVNWLCSKLNDDYEGKTIVVTHHAPSYQSIHSDYVSDELNGAYASDLEFVMTDQKQQPVLWCHGHVHDSFDYMVDKTRVFSNPQGYPTRDYKELAHSTKSHFPQNENHDNSKIISL